MDIYGHQVIDHDISAKFKTQNRPFNLGSDTIAFLQVLDQLYRLYKHPVEDYTEIHSLRGCSEVTYLGLCNYRPTNSLDDPDSMGMLLVCRWGPPY